MKRIAVMSSHRGTNLQAIIDGAKRRLFAGTVELVISNNKSSYALVRAREAGIPTLWISRKFSSSQEEFEHKIIDALSSHDIDIVCLAGFMRVLSASFIARYRGRMLNIHPALLPSFPGMDAQRQALCHGVKISGCTVHFVDEGVDTGPIILQRAVPVLDDDTVESLSERILAEEHVAYIEALKLVCEDRLCIRGNRVFTRCPEPTGGTSID